MSVKVHVSCNLEHFTNNIEVVDVAGSTVGDCLKDLAGKFPGIETGLFANDGKLLDGLDIWVNTESSFPLELLKPVKDGDALYITGNGGT
ncbi:molybdopterin synthase sulfur carrier subunit [Chloroflexota bacterium]